MSEGTGVLGRAQPCNCIISLVGLTSAYILAGGKSTRMGCDKALLEWSGRTLLAHAVELAKSVTGQVTIVGDPAKFATFGPVISDVYPEHGPLGGIHAALINSQTELNLIISIDLPFLETAFLEYLLSQAEATDALVTVPFANGRYQPLCAVYRKQFAETADRALKQERNKVDALFAEASVRIINEDELERAGFTNTVFRNVNTPEDLEQAKHEINARVQDLS